MTAQRATYLLPGLLAGAASMFVLAMPATAQVADDVVLNIMRECARIDDPTSRLACYDNNIRNAGAPRSTIPGEVRAEGGGAVAVPRGTTGFGLRGGSAASAAAGTGSAASGASGFGREDIRSPDRFNAAPPGEAAEIAARVTAVSPREPGVFAFTLEDGAEWLVTRGVGSSYRVPEAGSVVEISRGALGSFLMRYDGQESVRVRRTR
jgi:hypothetical protein